MALIHSFEKSGHLLFRYRGPIPAILFLIAVPFVYFTDYSMINPIGLIVLTLLSVAVTLLGFIIRAYTIGTTPQHTSGRNTKNQIAETLNTTGIYSVVRHPLYLGNYLMWIGIVIFVFNVYYFIIVSLAFWLYYERIMFAEERFLENKFGHDYLNWSLTVPAFIPKFTLFKKSVVPFSIISVLRREYSGMGAILIGYAFVDLLRYYLITENFEWNRLSVYFLVVVVIVALTLRTLKHHTKLLDEKGRS